MQEILKTITDTRPELSKLLLESHIKAFEILTDDEIIQALSMAANHKQALINREKYAEEIARPIEYPVYDDAELRDRFFDDYRIKYGSDFLVDEFNNGILNNLLKYFTGDDSGEYDLTKGLYLVGNPGCGKSSMMRILGFNTHQPFAFKSCIKISEEFSKEGYGVIEKYSKMLPVSKSLYFGFDECGWCFDDLGFEDKGKYYGKESEVMTDIIERAYNNRLMIGKMHITSNISGDEIEARYGNRIRSRMREMFNMVIFDENSPDRRK